MNEMYSVSASDLGSQIASATAEIEFIEADYLKAQAGLEKIASMLKALPRADGITTFDWNNLDSYANAPIRSDYEPYRDKLIIMRQSTKEKLEEAHSRLATAKSRLSSLRIEQVCWHRFDEAKFPLGTLSIRVC